MTGRGFSTRNKLDNSNIFKRLVRWKISDGSFDFKLTYLSISANLSIESLVYYGSEQQKGFEAWTAVATWLTLHKQTCRNTFIVFAWDHSVDLTVMSSVTNLRNLVGGFSQSRSEGVHTCASGGGEIAGRSSECWTGWTLESPLLKTERDVWCFACLYKHVSQFTLS